MLARFSFISLALLLFVCSAWYVRTNQVRGDRLNVIVLTVESLRADMVTPETTPHLVDTGHLGARFTAHRAVSGWTGANIVSLLSGLTPFQAGVHTRGISVAPEIRLPLEELSESGYRVEGIQGFMTMNIYRNLGLKIKPDYPDPLYHLALTKQAGQPFFFWYHYLDTHLPYHLPAGYEKMAGKVIDHARLSDAVAERLTAVQQETAIHSSEMSFQQSDVPLIHELQSSSIKEFDDWFNDFWHFFVNSGLRRDTILLLTADHGDEHGEHGQVGHASTTLQGHLHEEIVKIPLFLWLPPGKEGLLRSVDTSLTSTHVDIMKTLCSLLGIRLEGHKILKGRDLLHSDRPSEWLAMTSSGGFTEPDPGNIRYFEYGILAAPWKLLLRTDHEQQRSLQLYNLKNDPGEKTDLSATHPEITSSLLALLEKEIAERRTLNTASIVPSESSLSSSPAPVWVEPVEKRVYRYEDFQGSFKLEWRGPEDGVYILEYEAGQGEKAINGHLEVEGTSKDFGMISKRYWETWVIPYSPYRLRVRQKASKNWSRWLEIEAQP